MKKDNEGKFTVGTRFIGNINHAEFTVVDIRTAPNGKKICKVEHTDTKKRVVLYMDWLEHYNATIIE